MMHRALVFALSMLLALPVLAYNRTVQCFSVTDQPVAGAKIYYREFTGRIDMVYFGPTGATEEVLTTDANGRVQITKAIPTRMPSAFGSDYALILAEGYTPQLLPLYQLQNRIYLRPLAHHQLSLVLPDGSPAAGATVMITNVSGSTFQLNNPFCGIETPYVRVTADKNGAALLPCIRIATNKDGDTGVLLSGVAYTDGYVDEAVSLRSVGPSKFVITLKKAQQVRGVVTDAQGRAIADAVVRCAEYPLPTACTDQHGQFLFNNLPTTVPPLQAAGRTVDRSLTLYIDAPGYARQGISLLPTMAQADLFRISLEPLVTVTGKLIDRATGQPVTNSRQYGYYIRVRHSLGPYGEGRVGSTFLITNPDGAFTAQIPRQALLEVSESQATRFPFTPQDYREGDAITLEAVSR